MTSLITLFFSDRPARLAAWMTAALLLIAATTVRAQSNNDTLDWIGGPVDNSWTSPNPVWDDVSTATPAAVSISNSTANTYGFVFNGSNSSFGSGTDTPATMNIDATLNTNGIAFFPGFNTASTTTIGNADTTSPSILAHPLNFTSGGISDFANSGTVTFTPTVGGGNNVLYFTLSGTETFNANANTSLVLNLNIGNGSGTGSFVKSGAGTVVLGGSNSYNGTTAVNAGTLMLTGGSSVESATGTGALTVSNAGTVLAGNGVAFSNTTVNAGAILSPGLGGNSVAKLQLGTSAVGSGLTLNGTLRVDLVGGGTTAGINNDQVAVSGQLTLNPASSQLVIGSVNPAGLAVGQRFFLTLDSSASPVAGNFNGLPEGSMVTDPAGDTYTISYLTNGDGGTVGNDISLTVFSVVPEPSTWAAMLAGAGMLGVTLRRRVRRA